jgi:hypothetical protein
MSSFAERARLRAEARAAAATTRRGVRFIGNATGNTNVARSPTRKASPHHRNRGVTRRALRATTRVSPAGSPPQRPGRGARSFRNAIKRHERATRRASKKRSPRRKSRKSRKSHRRHRKSMKGRRGTRHHR